MGLYMNQRGEIRDIDDDLLGIVTEIRERFDVRVKYLDPDAHREITDAPYVITDQQDNVILTVWHLDRRVIDKLYQMQDIQQVQKNYELAQAANKAELARKAEEARAPAKDLMLRAFKSPKSTYTFRNDEGKLIKINNTDPTGEGG